MLPGITAILILRTADILKLFDVVYIMTKGGPGSATELISVFVQRVGFRAFDQGVASAQAIVLLIIATLLSRLYIKFVYKEV
jgi:multiple sugar transport system permease protein